MAARLAVGSVGVGPAGSGTNRLLNLGDSGPETQPNREEPRAARWWGHRDSAATGRGKGAPAGEATQPGCRWPSVSGTTELESTVDDMTRHNRVRAGYPQGVSRERPRSILIGHVLDVRVDC